MIVLVLDELGQVVFQRLLLFPPVQSSKVDRDPAVPAYLDQDVRKAHAVVPDLDELVAQRGQDRIHVHDRTVHALVDEPLSDADLGGGDGAACAVTSPEIHQGVVEIRHHRLHGLEFAPADGFAYLI
jgi:hypothetical protein